MLVRGVLNYNSLKLDLVVETLTSIKRLLGLDEKFPPVNNDLENRVAFMFEACGGFEVLEELVETEGIDEQVCQLGQEILDQFYDGMNIDEEVDVFNNG
jgi:hypothetical protein